MNEYIDSTLLKSDATIEDITKLCEDAKKYHFASVCVNPYYVPLAKELVKEDKVLVTCDDNNIGSAKVIENNGGVLENKVTNIDEYGEVVTRRYWIKIR